jgi:hypothetical protein
VLKVLMVAILLPFKNKIARTFSDPTNKVSRYSKNRFKFQVSRLHEPNHKPHYWAERHAHDIRL